MIRCLASMLYVFCVACSFVNDSGQDVNDSIQNANGGLFTYIFETGPLYGGHISYTDNKEIVVLYYKNNLVSINKYDSTRNMVWKNDIDVSTIKLFLATLIKTSDGTIKIIYGVYLSPVDTSNGKLLCATIGADGVEKVDTLCNVPKMISFALIPSSKKDDLSFIAHTYDTIKNHGTLVFYKSEIYRFDKSGKKIWEKKYGNIPEGIGQIYFITERDDGDYFLGGLLPWYGMTNGIFMGITDTSGDSIHKWNYPYGTVPRGRPSFRETDGGFVLNYGAGLKYYNLSGNILWQKVFRCGQRDCYAGCRAITNKGNIIVTATDGMYLLDSQGNEIWKKNKSSLNWIPIQIIPMIDEGFLLYGTGDKGSFFMKMDKDGNYIEPW